jgi:5-methyltetrahydrofolate--homocysteine methyltransferase
MLAKAVKELQSVSSAVLRIDTANAEAAERALRLYNGKPLLNWVNGKRESMESILPLAKKYGAVVVARTLDDSGIPESAEERIRMAEEIIAAAASYGIARKDIVVDTFFAATL